MRRNGYANISACGKYRYELGGDLGRGPYGLVSVIRMILWLMLNPSTHRWGCPLVAVGAFEGR